MNPNSPKPLPGQESFRDTIARMQHLCSWEYLCLSAPDAAQAIDEAAALIARGQERQAEALRQAGEREQQVIIAHQKDGQHYHKLVDELTNKNQALLEADMFHEQEMGKLNKHIDQLKADLATARQQLDVASKRVQELEEAKQRMTLAWSESEVKRLEAKEGVLTQDEFTFLGTVIDFAVLGGMFKGITQEASKSYHDELKRIGDKLRPQQSPPTP